MDRPLYPELKLPDELIRDLFRLNPWWQGQSLPVLPATRRHLVGQIHRRLELGLAPVTVVRGPRQIGKTTAQLHVIQDLLQRGVDPRRVLRLQTDELPALSMLEEPILRIVDWYEANILESSLNTEARAGNATYLFFDEVQNLRDWAPQIKALVDSSTTSAVVTGSSALRIELGRDSLAGRISTIEAGVLSLTEIASFRGFDLGQPALEDNGLEPLLDKGFWLKVRARGEAHATHRDEAFKWFGLRGGYPLVHRNPDAPWGALADQLNENVIRRVIQHDLRIGERGAKRDAPLLEEVFRLACRYVGQSPGTTMMAREIQRVLDANVGAQRIRHYLRFLGDTLLLRLIEPLEIRLKKRRGSPKICLADHGLRASWLQEVVPLHEAGLAGDPHLHQLAGRIAESVVGATLSTVPGLDIAHLPERAGDPEVDFILTVGTHRVPVEVKYQRRIDSLADTEGLRTFLEKAANNAPFGLLITRTEVGGLDDPRIVTVPLSSFLLIR